MLVFLFSCCGASNACFSSAFRPQGRQSANFAPSIFSFGQSSLRKKKSIIPKALCSLFMIDTHSHLWFDRFEGEIPQAIERARAAGVHTMLQVGCDEQSSRKSVELAEQYEGLYAIVGVHPTEVGKDTGKLNWMRDLIRSSKKVVGIGETGIDYYHEPYDAELQQETFRSQCEIAQEFGLPVVVHLRMGKNAQELSGRTPAERDCLKVLDEVGMKPGKVLFHCFSGDRGMAEEVLKRGWFISFSGVLTYPNAGELREVAKICPLDRMVVETDSPFLSPQKYRGQRNEPAYVVEVAKVIAELKGLSLEEIEKATDENARLFFLLS